MVRHGAVFLSVVQFCLHVPTHTHMKAAGNPEGDTTTTRSRMSWLSSCGDFFTNRRYLQTTHKWRWKMSITCLTRVVSCYWMTFFKNGARHRWEMLVLVLMGLHQHQICNSPVCVVIICILQLWVSLLMESLYMKCYTVNMTTREWVFCTFSVVLYNLVYRKLYSDPLLNCCQGPVRG